MADRLTLAAYLNRTCRPPGRQGRSLAVCLVSVLALVLMPSAVSAQAARVFALTYPAWVVRDHKSLPLTPGFELEAADLLRTGAGSRLMLQLPDGSAIKLGESARLLVESVENGVAGAAATAADSSFRAAFHLLRGALRFTPAVWEDRLGGRAIALRLGGLRAVIDGDTDLWGQSDGAVDLLCLLDGEVVVESGREDSRRLDRSTGCLSRDADSPGSEIRSPDAKLLQTRLAKTEFGEVAGVAAHDGEWHLVLISLTSLAKAEQVAARFRESGFPVWRKSVIRDGKTLHRILLPGFVSIDAGLRARDQVERLLGVGDAWVWKAIR